jgi:cap1 methyltransferase
MDESENSKRRRRSAENHERSCSSPSGKLSADRDCYHGILNGTLDVDTVGQAHFSWLTDLQWICSSRCSSQENEPFMSIDEPDDINDYDIVNDVAHIGKQLLQVKRRLRPAAESCANANTEASSNVRSSTSSEFAEARRACNPMEALGEGQHNGLNCMFMNRSAIKLANIDAALGFCLTTYTTSCTTLDEPFTFVDLCGAPGGFSEYVLWRCFQSSRPSRGFGMSLNGSNEHGRGLQWKLQESASSAAAACRYRICHGQDGTGDIQHWENIESLKRMIRDDINESWHSTNNGTQADHPNTNSGERVGGRVHLVLADGGLDAQRDSENQEQVAQKLVVCEVAAALSLLQTRGTLVLKLFGFQTPVIRAVLHYLFVSFQDLVAIKPISSRPASAERYLVCVGFCGNPAGWDGRQWCNHMYLGQLPSRSTYQHAPGRSTRDIDCVQRCLAEYLNKFERDLTSLNLKACFAILSYLERKYMHLLQSSDSEQWDDFYCDDADHTSRVNIAAYKIAWNLN